MKAKYLHHFCLKLISIFFTFWLLYSDYSLQCLLCFFSGLIYRKLKTIFTVHKLQGFPQAIIMEGMVPFLPKICWSMISTQRSGTGEVHQSVESSIYVYECLWNCDHHQYLYLYITKYTYTFVNKHTLNSDKFIMI